MFPFIVGCGRSGTTLLVSMLDSHPDLAIPGESGFLLEMCASSAKSDKEGLVQSFCAELEAFDRFRAWKLDLDDLRRDLEEQRPDDRVEAMRITYAHYAAREGKTLYGDKTPDHVLQIPELAKLFPEARFVHLIRDGRDVALANLDVPWGPATLPAAARYWRQRVSTGRQAGAALGPKRYLEVRYEELVADPSSVLHKVTEFLGLEFDPAMLRSDEAVRRQFAMSPDPSLDKSLLLPVTKGLRDWRRDMSADDLAVFELIAGPLLEELGYPRAATSVSLPLRMRFYAHESLLRLLDSGRRVRRKLSGNTTP